MNEDRIIDIETRLTFQDGVLQELNQVVCQQQRRIEGLEETCRMLLLRLRELSQDPATGPTDERPPHY